LDLDLLAYGDRVLRLPELTVPHARMHERRFVLAPLVEIHPEWIHPVLKKSARELLAELSEVPGQDVEPMVIS
jgi:2-amino-4-hydroxy-6-hydroxymethyldihydropteridine diphosphokinase